MTDSDSDGAIKLFIEAIDIYESEEKHIYIADTWRNCLAIMLRYRPWPLVFHVLAFPRLPRVMPRLEERASAFSSGSDDV